MPSVAATLASIRPDSTRPYFNGRSGMRPRHFMIAPAGLLRVKAELLKSPMERSVHRTWLTRNVHDSGLSVTASTIVFKGCIAIPRSFQTTSSGG